ncbi:MAG: hypothetical protein Kow0019_03770 [Methanobacteriaceae archaeon]
MIILKIIFKSYPWLLFSILTSRCRYFYIIIHYISFYLSVLCNSGFFVLKTSLRLNITKYLKDFLFCSSSYLFEAAGTFNEITWLDASQLIDVQISKSKNFKGIVMQSKPYTCGPAALATALNNIGIISTEDEISKLAGTDHTGTSMYGLLKAAKIKGVKAAGMRISIDKLRTNNIVFLTINGCSHYSVIIKIIQKKVILADPALGKIKLTKNQFEEIYSGKALILIIKEKK